MAQCGSTVAQTAMASSSETKAESGSTSLGYNVKLYDIKNLDRYTCQLCNLLLREPVQSERGEVACGQCYKQKDQDDGICPIDKEPYTGKVNRDKAKEKDVLALLCYCRFESLGCSWIGKVRDIDEHERECRFKSEKCQFCDAALRTSDMRSHLNICPALISQGCPFLGCDYTSANGCADELKRHMGENVIFHSYLQAKSQKELLTRIISMESTQQTLLIEKEEKEKELVLVKEQNKEMQAFAQNALAKPHKQEDRILLLENHVRRLLQESDPLRKTTTSEKENSNISRLSNEVSLLNKNLFELNLRQQLFENSSFDGKIVWKIDNVASRMRQAVSGRVTALHSAPAFTQRHGYKFCARLYLNGDGLGKNNHVSLFFVLMKSEYDNRLTWPFRQKINFRLVNQRTGGSDIIESFSPEQQSTSFRKPVTDMNVASGCPMFVGIQSFTNGGFVKDDCVFIDIEVGEINCLPS